MLLQLDSKHRITVDSSHQNYQLEVLQSIMDKKTREVVREDWVIAGFHGLSFKSVLNQYSKLALINSEQLDSINSVLDKLKEIENTILRVVRKENIRLETTANEQ